MLSTIIFNRSLYYFYRLVKPNISQFNSIQELEYDRKQRQLAIIQQQNISMLQENKSFTKQKFLTKILNTSQEMNQEILKRQMNFSAISPKSLKHHTISKPFANSQIDYPFSLEQVQSALPDLTSIPMHFSYNRGIPILNQYQDDKKIAYVFNLPDEFSSRQVSQKLGVETIKQIKVEYCRLGLPAYAKVYFNTDEAVNNLVLNNRTYIELGGRICFIKTHFDREKLQLKNRRLVIHDLQQDQQQLIFELSKYGRITHFDYPTFITRNPSLQQVRQKYKNSDTLIKINHHRKDGTIGSQFYPSLQETFRMNTIGTTLDFDANMVQKKQRLQAMYKNRMRYAHEIDVHEGKQNEISIKNMGYCIVTYSCTEQAQNCYFNLRFSNRIQLFDAKTMEEFEIDQQYRKRILRLIDSEHQKAKEKANNTPQSVYQKQVEEYFDELSMFDKLVDLQTQRKALRETADQMYQEEPQVLISYFNTRVGEIKKNLQLKMGSKSFDELAELELFGRVLPKHDKQPKIVIQVMEENSNEMNQLLQHKGIRLSPQSIKARDNFYRKKKSREIKRMGMDNNIIQNQFDGEEQGEERQIDQHADADQDYDGQKHGFSTSKKRAQAFRTRTALQLANYMIRYCEYIRSVINEYQGVFPESRFSYTTSPTFVNPESIYFADSTPYIGQEDLPKFLECMRTFEESQKMFSEFWKDYQFIKSRSIDINQFKHNVRNGLYESLRGYFDDGCVKEVYQVEEGEDIDKKVFTLNATVAGFGEQFKTHVDQNGNKVIIKIAKIQNIYPLDKMNKISQAKAKFDANHQPTAKQLELFQKYKYQIIETGEIPAEVRQQFNISEDKSLDDLFEELAAESGIYKKDIEMLLNLENFTEEQIGQDISLQVELEKARIAEKQSRASDYAKDPYNIEVRDKEGYFKVSKFRQI